MGGQNVERKIFKNREGAARLEIGIKDASYK